MVPTAATTKIVKVGGMSYPKNKRNLLPCTVRTFKQRSYNQK